MNKSSICKVFKENSRRKISRLTLSYLHCGNPEGLRNSVRICGLRKSPPALLVCGEIKENGKYYGAGIKS